MTNSSTEFNLWDGDYPAVAIGLDSPIEFTLWANDAPFLDTAISSYVNVVVRRRAFWY